MNTLILFDGMSCGQLALRGLGIEPENYFASEVDKYAILTTQTNFPNTVQLGDVCKVRADDLPKIDLLIGGSPCQGFSSAGRGLNFQDPRSKLFFEYVRILNECHKRNPDVIFLLENVVMEREHQVVISKYLGVEPIRINSALVVAQNRDRLYWTNINTRPINLFGDLRSSIPQPKDRGVMLVDVLEEDVPEKYFVTDAALKRIGAGGRSIPKILPEKTGCILPKNNSGQMSLDSGTTFIPVVNDRGKLREVDQSGCLDANYSKGMDNHGASTMIVHAAQIQRRPDGNGALIEQIEISGSGKANPCLTSPNKSLLFYTRKGKRSVDSKSPTVTANRYEQNNHLQTDRLRRLTPGEVCALQGVPKDYFFKDDKQIVSDTQIYRMIGNGWTIPVIEHILSFGNFCK